MKMIGKHLQSINWARTDKEQTKELKQSLKRVRRTGFFMEILLASNVKSKKD
jgi:hypothetical protein